MNLIHHYVAPLIQLLYEKRRRRTVTAGAKVRILEYQVQFFATGATTIRNDYLIECHVIKIDLFSFDFDCLWVESVFVFVFFLCCGFWENLKILILWNWEFRNFILIGKRKPWLQNMFWTNFLSFRWIGQMTLYFELT